MDVARHFLDLDVIKKLLPTVSLLL